MDLSITSPSLLLVKSRSSLVTWPRGLDSFVIKAEAKVPVSVLQSSIFFSAPQTKFSFRRITQRLQKNHDIETSLVASSVPQLSS